IVYILYRELMTYGVDFEQSLRDAMKAGIRFVRFESTNPPEIVGNGIAQKVRIKTETGNLEIPADGVVITVPFVPAKGRDELSQMLKVPLNADGFFLEAHVKLRPVEFSTDGVFLCGTARAPATIPECVLQGYAAASKASALMAKHRIKVEAINAFVDRDRCSGCNTCVGLCPYHAISMRDDGEGKKAFVNAVQCKGCGTCVAACPSGALQQKGFTDDQIFAMIDTDLAVGV
ncbi:MAG TPA: 4Fe-4S binding protein, partial [Fimbriimonadaceae bacterium]|nr:4Fe-4S binding protein [Fimbriimonadaceae bacterium]